MTRQPSSSAWEIGPDEDLPYLDIREYDSVADRHAEKEIGVALGAHKNEWDPINPLDARSGDRASSCRRPWRPLSRTIDENRYPLSQRVQKRNAVGADRPAVAGAEALRARIVSGRTRQPGSDEAALVGNARRQIPRTKAISSE
jgi:hypothetical protein